MPFLADVVLPYFIIRYLTWFFPFGLFGILMVLGLEFGVYYLRDRTQFKPVKLFSLVSSSNFVSFTVGLVIMFFLPSGLQFVRIGQNDHPRDMIYIYNPNYDLFVFLLIPAAWVLSCVIEYFCIRRSTPPASRGKLWWSCVYANLASYAFLYAWFMYGVFNFGGASAGP
jgi:hypothetical protein